MCVYAMPPSKKYKFNDENIGKKNMAIGDELQHTTKKHLAVDHTTEAKENIIK